MLEPLLTTEQKEAAAQAEKAAIEKPSSPLSDSSLDVTSTETSHDDSQTSQSITDAEVSFDIG
jgi:hypothetical protein